MLLLPLDKTRSIQNRNFRRWMVLATGSELIEDVRKAPDDALSLLEPTIEVR
jgi:hypothetical protein